MIDKEQQHSKRLDSVVARARKERDQRMAGYREQALERYPWICGRCSREFDRQTVHGLTVHHRDHDHDHNPADGSNWELLCLYCHDNEHTRQEEQHRYGYSDNEDGEQAAPSNQPFAGLKSLLKNPRG